MTSWRSFARFAGNAPGIANRHTPRSPPALQRADRVQEKASKVGFDWDDPNDVWKKVEEELRELRHEIEQQTPQEKIEEEFGDLLFALVNYARFIGVSPEEALQRT